MTGFPSDQPGPLFILPVATTATVAGATGRRVVVTKLVLSATAAGALTLSDGTTTVSITLAVGGIVVLPFDGSGWFQTAQGGTLTVAGAAAPTGWLEYYQG